MQKKETAVQKVSPVQPARPSALSAMAKRLNVEPEKLLGTLSSTCFKNSTPEQMLALVVVSNEYGLNPFLKEIYAFPAKGGGIVPVVSIDGWIKMVNRSPEFDGLEFEFVDNSDGSPFSCGCKIYIKGRSRPVVVTEYFSECFRKTEPWEAMPRRMLRHKALIQCARVAFGFSGIQDEEEAIDVVGTVHDVPIRQLATTISPKQNEDGDLGPQAVIDTPSKSVRAEFQQLLDDNKIPFSIFQRWGEETGNVPDATSISSIEEISEDVLKRLLRAKSGLIAGMKSALK